MELRLREQGRGGRRRKYVKGKKIMNQETGKEKKVRK